MRRRYVRVVRDPVGCPHAVASKPLLRTLSLSFSLLLSTVMPVHAVKFPQAELARATALQKRLVALDSHLDTPANLARPDFDVLQAHACRRWITRAWSKPRWMAVSGRFTSARAIAVLPRIWTTAMPGCSVC